MNHSDHVYLLRRGVPTPAGHWADLGAGTGAFTLALAELLGPAGTIYAVDRDRHALNGLASTVRQMFPQAHVETLVADFTQHLDLPVLDGIVMANSLHFQREPTPVIMQVKSYLRPGGRLLVVEYDVDVGNTWVPYPLSYTTWAALADRCGFYTTRRLATVPSRFLRAIYAAESINR